MKKILIVLMLLGVMTLEAKPKYRIKIWTYDGITMYEPQQKVWIRTTNFYFPLKIWESASDPFIKKSQAENVIKNLKIDYQNKQNNKNPQYILIE